MTKLTLNNIANLQNESSVVTTLANNNAATIEAVENTLSRDGTTPNHMNADLDMNGNRIINLPDGVLDQEPATFGQLQEYINTVEAGAVIDASYVTLGTDIQLQNERVLTEGPGINITDGGAGSTVTVAVDKTELNSDVGTLTNKTVDLTSNTLTGTKAQFNTALSDDDFTTLTGSETLTNKTLTNPTVSTGTFTSPTLITPALGTPASGTLTNTTGFPTANLAGLGTGVATFLATPTSANLRGALTDEVGTGGAYFVGGALGTPASGTLTSATGLPISTGVSGLGTGVATFLATPTSANLRGAISDEVGTGAAYFVGGALGTPASGTATNLTGLPLSGLTNQAAYTIVANNTSGSAAPTAVDVPTITLKASPVAGDIVLIQDSAASNAFKRTTVGALASAGSVSSLGGQTGVLTFDGGSMSSTVMAVPRYDAAQSLTAAQKSQVHANIGGHSKNYVINGGLQVSQENGTTAGTTSSYYPADMFVGVITGTSGAFSVAQVASVTPSGSTHRIRVTATTADAAVAAGDLVAISTRIEGFRAADLLFGNFNAKTVTIQFGVKAPAGTYCLTLINNAANKSYIAEYVITGGEANTDVVKSVTIAGDTGGTWLKDNGAGIMIYWGLMVGSTYQQAANSWGTGNCYGSSSQFNFMGTINNVFELFDVSLTEGTVAPPFQLIKYDEELAACQRYWMTMGGVSASATALWQFQAAAGGNTHSYTLHYPVTMRAAPTVTAVNPTTANLTSASFFPDTLCCSLQLIAAAAGLVSYYFASSGPGRLNFSARI